MTANSEANAGPEEVYGDELPKGTELLRGQYKIARFLNSGGFGITYLARDSLDRIVVIKECFPSAMCCRQGQSVRVRSKDHSKEFESIVRLFGQEARALAKLDHPNIVGVHQVFEDNHTAYMALDFVRGRDLLDIIDEEPERLNPDRIRSMLRKILEAVEYIHDRGILHRDISPDNILLDQNDEPVLIDFGAAREEATRKSRVLSSHHTVKDGYSPQEFYVAGSTQTVASDLYALGATFYHLIAGDPPPVSQTRLAAVAANKKDPYVPLSTLSKDYDSYFLSAIDRALEIFPDDRIQSAREWLIAIDQDTRRQAAVERAEHDQFLQKTIRMLVEETNKVVLEARSQEPKEKKAAPAPTPPRRKSLFPDLMGPPPPDSGDPVTIEAEDAVARPHVSPSDPADDEIVATKDRPRRLLGRMLNVSLWRMGQSQNSPDEVVGKVDR
ncbi:serine/threonine-protein kinase [Ovoidimarina sediminis]|uniref:serine/threonine-protein kinase n=1 Tax=Ovoidimarina sediminis TaxID=3079856 RepID=UPI002914D7C3|nr:serine/threonine-protein kinase [Rhodophyticola sp. MJ-SS7]MDU8943346.1 serine/threonine-protein kinase [Rhodophyticola sp. MJ-SS7]